MVAGMRESPFHLAEILVHCLSQGSSRYCHQERNDPLQKLKVEKNKRSRKDATFVISSEYFLGLPFLKLVLFSCYFCETPLLLYTNQYIMDSRT